MRDRLLWGPAIGWAIIICGILLTASVLLGRLPKGFEEQLRRGAPAALIRSFYGGVGLGLIVFGVGLVRQDGFLAGLGALASVMWGAFMRLLISLKSWEDGDRS